MFAGVEHVTYAARYSSTPDWLNGAQRIDETIPSCFEPVGMFCFDSAGTRVEMLSANHRGGTSEPRALTRTMAAAGPAQSI